MTELRLPIAAAEFDAQLEQCGHSGLSAVEFVWRLLEPQLLYRRQRAIERRIDAAKFPCKKSLDNFDWAFQPTLDRDRVMAWATLDFARRGQNLLIGGESGTGKSHIAIAIGYLACAAGIRTRYTSSADMLATLAASLAMGTLADALKPYVRPELLIVDEVGLDRPERDSQPDAQLFYKVIRPRYDAPLSTIITSNIDWDAWGTYLGDDLASVAILDRLVHHGHLLTINGPSYRAAQHSKLNSSTAPSQKGETQASQSASDTSPQVGH